MVRRQRGSGSRRAPAFGWAAGAAAHAALLGTACGAPGAEPTSERESLLGPFLEVHWSVPIAPQGAAPESWSSVEASLDAAHCGACHPEQLRQWRDSLHAGAFSPGFAGQLIEGALAEPAELRQCQSCHAPLAEQLPSHAAVAERAVFDPELRRQGVVCAACHVRSHARYGPPRRADFPAPTGPVAHGGFEARPEFQESRFCAACHQFFDDPGVNGKPLENTFAEWRESPQAAAGRTCQSCHMPDRAHTWRGIHDPEMVRSGVDTDLIGLALDGATLSAALVLANRDVGHAFPTYVTPRVHLEIWQADAAGGTLEGTLVAAVIGREIDLTRQPPREVFDTRVPPGKSVKLEYARERHASARWLVGRVHVDPGHHYRGVFDALLASLQSSDARARIAEARRRTDAARYDLARFELALPPHRN